MQTIDLGIKLADLRKQKGISQTELAEELGLTRASISYYEKGERIPSDENKVKMANFFGKSVQEIFFEQ